MAWFKIDDAFDEHDKIGRITDPAEHAAAVAAWTLCGASCARRLTDGVVTRAAFCRALALWPADMREAAAAALVRVGLWDLHPDGWAFHDWLEYQPSRADVLASREASKARAAKSRSGNTERAAHVQRTDDAPASHVQSTCADGAPLPIPIPIPIPVVENATATDAFSATSGKLWTEWAKHYAQHRGGQMAADSDGQSKREATRVLIAEAERRGVPVTTLIAEVMGAYWSDPWPRDFQHRPSIKNLLGQLDRLLAAPGAVKDPPDYDPKRDGTPKEARNDRVWNAWIAKGCP